MKNPCTRNCPDRNMTCRTECEKYKAYSEWREAMYAERQKNFIIRDYQTKNIIRYLRRAGKK